MIRVKAQELLDNPDYINRLTMDGYYNLLLRAGYSKELATKATSQRSWERLNAGERI